MKRPRGKEESGVGDNEESEGVLQLIPSGKQALVVNFDFHLRIIFQNFR